MNESFTLTELDPFTGIETEYVYDAAEDRFYIYRQSSHMQAILDANQEIAAANAGGSWGDGRVYATVPLHLCDDLDKAVEQQDRAWIDRFLRDNPKFRTFGK